MPIVELTPKAAADQQLDSYNQAGGASGKNTFTLPASTAFAVVGCIVADSAVIGDVPTLEAAIEALDEVTAAVPLAWGQSPAEILVNVGEATHETVLVVSADVSQTVAHGGGKGHAQRTRLAPATQIRPPLGKKYVVWGLQVPASLDQAGIATLTAAVTGSHAGISSTHHLLDAVVDAEAVGDATLVVSAHTRIDRIPAEPVE